MQLGDVDGRGDLVALITLMPAPFLEPRFIAGPGSALPAWTADAIRRNSTIRRAFRPVRPVPVLAVRWLSAVQQREQRLELVPPLPLPPFALGFFAGTLAIIND
ncbi:MAG: hypothetical protein WDN00_18580 [Limisphaerales bacterium]